MKPKTPFPEKIADAFMEVAGPALVDAIRALSVSEYPSADNVVLLVKTSEEGAFKAFRAFGDHGCRCETCATGYVKALADLLGGRVEVMRDEGTLGGALH